jgi:anaerobic nitric oxide reductase transcription regulator
MGCSLWVNQQLVGALTFDALQPGLFDTITDTTIAGFAALAAATLHNVGLIRMLERSRAHQQELAQELVRDAHRREGTLIGKSTVIHQLRQHIDMVAHTDLNVLIQGETGTGKELVARTLHAHSQRKHQPLVYINCAALPEQIAESELFGHVKGAFTGAIQARAGKFELANHGTLFLDEIGELNINLQAKLLRALQQGEIQRVGADQPVQVDVRIIAATNRDLIREISKGNFRSDLYHRLNVFPIQVPALRDHTSDLPQLSSYFLEQARRKLALPQIGLHPDALVALEQYDWPGNVRELEHLLMRASLRAAGQCPQGKILIQSTHLDLPTEIQSIHSIDQHTKERATDDILQPDHHEVISLRDAIDHFQRQLIQQTLELTHGNWSEAARRLQIDRANLSRLSLRLGIKG